MAAPESYRADIPAEYAAIYDRELLTRAVPLLVHALFGQKRNLPANAGSKVVKFRRYGTLAAATAALTEGTAPTGKSLSVTDLTATLLQYGDWTKFSDEISTQTLDPILLEASGIFGDQAGDTFDQLGRDVLAAGSIVQYAGAAVSRVTVADGMYLDVAEVKEAVKTLQIAKARKLTQISGAAVGQGTQPINAAYVGIVGPNTLFDLKNDPKWASVEKYASNVVLLPGEVGTLDEVRFVMTTNAKKFAGAGAGGIDVHATLILAANAYGVLDLANSQASSLIYKGLGSAGTADPLNQVQTLGWKSYFVAKILNDDFMVRIEHAVTA
jgi:N4-gp56 family major capsid protein